MPATPTPPATDAANAPLTVTHDSAESRFVMTLPEGGEGVLVYVPRDGDQGAYQLVHTGVPEQAQGRGYATKLVAGALDQIAAEGGQIVAQCPFVVDFLERHSGYAHLVADKA